MRATAIALVAGGVALSLCLAWLRRFDGNQAPCGQGFERLGGRCLPAAGTCPAPLARTARGCEVPRLRILVPARSFWIGSTDWDLDGRLPGRPVQVAAFRIDAFEISRGDWGGNAAEGDAALVAASGMTRQQASDACIARGGRLPSEDEWIAAATAGADSARRYPWGDTGAVCRRAAWGLESGPCGDGADGPDTVGAHMDGDSALGLHDMAGNVAEWVAPDPSRPRQGVAKGGSWGSGLASELRIWARIELPPDARSPQVGARCAYDP